MNDWWKAPVLQGDENDYGQYDYMIEEIPQDYAKWELSKYKWQCDDCGKDRHLLFETREHFRTLDGYDYLDYSTCWMCAIKNWFVGVRFSLIYNTHKKINAFKDALTLYNANNNQWSFRDCYKICKKLH